MMRKERENNTTFVSTPFHYKPSVFHARLMTFLFEIKGIIAIP